ncbi:cobalt-precorrin 5A hydrolase [Clostridium sp. D2Q-11]|uniref:Cobalt-precorrin 5A hydrolase n=1 Tax=Anaeromonas frigoriresistens TaxID=2683708 RepID=A0A942UV41_9FIRM|nr:cobalt-precorrin 5A hydrolase [Anaeromonas frigoriresistens]
MKLAIITLTKGGIIQAKRIKSYKNNADIYTLDKYCIEELYAIEGKLSEYMPVLFEKYDTLLFIMATGVVVRSISKHIKHKTLDPAILVMDEKGRFIISLLSGHIGGANEAAQSLANLIGAQPVITTASDVKGVIPIDMLAIRLKCYIDNMEDAKDITSLLVNEEPVGIETDISIDPEILKGFILKNQKEFNSIKGIVNITNKKEVKSSYKSVQLVPQNIVIGIGCRRGISRNKILEAINLSMNDLNLHIKSIKALATIDVKRDEIGILDAAKCLHIPLTIIDRDRIKRIESKFNSSDFVRKTIGVGSVCEPCGYIVSKKGKCLMRKKAYEGITISIWKEEMN